MQDRLKAIGGWFADVPAGRRSKYAVVGVWIVILIAIGPLAGKFEDAQENDPADYLPANAESVKAIDRARGLSLRATRRRDHRLPSRRRADRGDRAAIEQTRRRAINAERPEDVGETGPPISPRTAARRC